MNTPKCKICGDQHQLDQFDSSAWIQYYSKPKPQISEISKSEPSGINQVAPLLKWICPQCSEDIGYTKLNKQFIDYLEEIEPVTKSLMTLWKYVHKVNDEAGK